MEKFVNSGHTAQSINRINKEYETLRHSKNPYWYAAPLSEENMFEWHFTIRGPADSDFEGGMYHGKLLIPENYPRSPPTLFILHQNGRFEIGKKICMTASPYHPEFWHPSWGISTMLNALNGFFTTPAEGLLNSVDWSSAARKEIAKKSALWKCPACQKSNSEITSEFCLEAETAGPVLPAIMVPQSVRMKNPYLRYDKSDVLPPEPESSMQEAPPNIENDLEARRQRRRRVQNTSQSSLSFKNLLQYCISAPIPSVIKFCRTASPNQWRVVLLDFSIFFSTLYLVYLLFDILKYPRYLAEIFRVP